MAVGILCKRGSQSAKNLSELCEVPRIYWNSKKKFPADVDLLINWGTFGEARRRIINRYPKVKTLTVLNDSYPGNKLKVIQELQEETKVPIPITCKDIEQRHYTNTHWIYKPKHSAGGNGIFRIDHDTFPKCNWQLGYAQQEVRDRRYELRVSAFVWMSPASWGFWKKVCEDKNQLCWNHEQGGKFITVNDPLKHKLFQRCIEHSYKILDTLFLDFGAIDFIIDSQGNEYFMEVNTQPGFTAEYGGAVYSNAINALNGLDKDEHE